jgi:hypothetical protein
VDSMGAIMWRELMRTQPDYVIYVPGSLDGSTHDTGNEHLMVFDGPDGELKALWTQSTFEGQPDQRIVFTRSPDGGFTWDAPRVIAGPQPPAQGPMASWGFPLVSRSGRIYVIYNKHIGVNDVFTHTTGLMAGIYSDDAGATWSPEGIIAMRRSKWDHPDASVPANWIVWQRPRRLSEGKYFTGFTRWVSKAVRHPPPQPTWMAEEAVVEFMRFENLDDDPAVEDLEISWHACDDAALRVGFPGHPEVSALQEPSLVMLPDGRLFVVMRSPRGNPYWSVSADAGRSWSEPQVLRYQDDGPPVRHPCSPCPLYELGPGRYLLFYHNHDGHFGPWGPFDSLYHRRPLWYALGEARLHARQPIWFSPPRLLMDNDGVAIGYRGGRTDLAMYASFTVRGSEAVLWYPDRKFFLLGRRITAAMLEGLTVPS